MSDKTIQVPEAEFKALLEGMKNLQTEIKGLKDADKPKIMRAPTQRVVTICYVNGKPVIGYVNKGTDERPTYIYEAVNPKKPTEYLLYVDLILKGDEENPLKVQYNEFLEQAETHECEITNIKKEEWSSESGTTFKKEVPNGAYHTDETGIIVPLESRGFISIYTVKMPNGEPLVIHERYVNIKK